LESSAINPNNIEKVKKALLCMQRHSWEQGVASQALLELGENELVILFAKEAITRQLPDGRLGVVNNLNAVTDPGANGESVMFAYKQTGDVIFKEALDKMIEWFLVRAPRNKNGIIYHISERAQMWVDTLFMMPPFLAKTGYFAEAIKQIEGHIELLYDKDKKLFSHMWDDTLQEFARKDFWSVGNGWAVSGMTRVILTLPDEYKKEKEMLIGYVKECVDSCLSYMRDDGLFYNVVDNKSTFVETNLAQMLSYTIYRGMVGGWFSLSYLEYAEKMREAAHRKVDEYGLVQGVCGAPYFDHAGWAPEGQAFFLFMEAAARDFYDWQAKR